MRLRLVLLLAGIRARWAWRSLLTSVPGEAAGLVAMLAVAAIVTAGFVLAVVMVRTGPCQRLLSADPRPHWVTSCGRQP